MRVSSMKTVKITLAACAAALALAACGGGSSGGSGSTSNSGSGSTSSSGSTSGGGSSTTDSTSCKDQGKQWKKDNTGTLKDFESAIKGFTSGVPSPASAKKLETVANEAASHPLPTCADPKGLWVKAMHQGAIAGKDASKGGVGAMADALPALKKALDDLNQLQTEVKNKVDLGQI
jgi:hypothetical protein